MNISSVESASSKQDAGVSLHMILCVDLVTLLERAEQRYTRMMLCFKQISYGKGFDRLRLCTLVERRNRADLLQIFRISQRRSLTSCSHLLLARLHIV